VLGSNEELLDRKLSRKIYPGRRPASSGITSFELDGWLEIREPKWQASWEVAVQIFPISFNKMQKYRRGGNLIN